MRRIIGHIVACCCLLAVMPVQAAGLLINREVFPFTNPGFEENLKDWAGSSGADQYRTGTPAYDPTSTPKITCEAAQGIAGAGGKSLCIPLATWVDAVYLPRTFQVTRGKKYLLQMKVKTAGTAYAYLRVVSGASGEPSSLRIGPNTDWQQIGVCFNGTDRTYGVTNPNPALSYCELRLHAFGQGKAYFDDVHVYELDAYAPTLRVQLLGPNAEKYRVSILARVWYPKNFSTRTFFADEGVQPGAPSGWMNLAEDPDFTGNPFSSVPNVIPIGIHFERMDGTPFSNVKAQIDFASGSEDGKIIKTIVAETPGNVIGVFIPRSEAPPDDFVIGFRTISDDVRERNSQVQSLRLPPVNLKQFHIDAHIGGFNRFHSDPALTAIEIDTLRRIGFSALSTEYSGMANMFRELGVKAGFTKTSQTERAFNLPMASPYTVDPTYRQAIKQWGSVCLANWDDIKRNISQAVGQWHISLKNEDPLQLPLIKFIDIGDEIGGWIFAGKEYDTGYREYLQRHGITPKEMGGQSWDDIMPGSWDWNDSINRRPKDKTDIVACRNYYWSLKYWTWTNARVYSIMTKELDKRFPGIPTRVNFGQPWTNACSDIRGTEIWEFARQKSVTALNNEDWLNTSGWRSSGIQLNAYLTDLNRSCALIHQAGVQEMIMPEGERQIQRKMASVVGKGAKELDLYCYGPFYASPDNWSQDVGEVKGVSTFLRKLGKAEEVLFPGVPRKNEIAVIWSATNEIWRESDASVYNQHYIYFGLLHKQIPIDFIDEGEIEKGRLREYTIAYLSCQYMRKATQRAVLDWVKAGGCLWTDAFCATGDEYGQTSTTLYPAIGIDKVTFSESPLIDYRPEYGLVRQKPLDVISFKDSAGTVDAIGTRVHFALTDPAKTTILAAFRDGSPAVIEHRYGKGKVYFVGTLAGCSYGRTVKRYYGQIETGYSTTHRRLIADFPARAGYTPPLTCSVPTVEADLLESKAGIGVVLANYAGEQALPKVSLTVSVPKKISSVRSVEHGVLPFTYDAARRAVQVTLPLSLVDFLLLK